MLLIFTLLVALIVGYAQMRNGLFSSIAMLVQVMLAGVITFNFWEPLADQFENYLRGGRFAGYEDWLVLTLLFAVSLGVLRTVTNSYLNPDPIEYQSAVQQLGGGVVGLLTGYLVAGFLVCVFQTMPVAEDFLGYEPRRADEPEFRTYLPSDRVWLAMMRHAGAYPLSWQEDNAAAETAYDRYQTFDRDATFEMRYLRYRRSVEGRPPLPYQGEFDREIYRKK